MRRAVCVVAALASACLFPSLDFTGGGSGGDGATESGSDAQGDVAMEAGFTAGIGCTAIATPDMLAYYTVDEGSGSVVHDCISSPKNDGAILAAAHTSWVTGQHGKALEIDPSAGVCVGIDLTPSFTFGGSSSPPFTVAMWISIVTLPVTNEIGYIAGQSSNIAAAGWRFSVAPGGVVQLAVGNNGITNVVGPAITAGGWHFIAAVYGGANSAVYLDAQSVQGALPAFVAAGASDHTRIGCSSDDQHQLNARVDDVRFYNRALSPGEIAIVRSAQ